MIPEIKKECIKPLLDTKYIKVADLQYAEGCHYFNATRRSFEDMAAIKSADEFSAMVPDAVTAAVILISSGEEPRLLLAYEYRYPAGRFLLSPPAGLIDEEDFDAPEGPVLNAAGREIFQETGLKLRPSDRLFEVNPLLFSTPGITDECNAIACAVVENADLSSLTQQGAVGTECFGGFELVTEAQARDLIKQGRDKNGIFYSAYTWIVLMYFVSGMWKQ